MVLGPHPASFPLPTAGPGRERYILKMMSSPALEVELVPGTARPLKTYCCVGHLTVMSEILTLTFQVWWLFKMRPAIPALVCS